MGNEALRDIAVLIAGLVLVVCGVVVYILARSRSLSLILVGFGVVVVVWVTIGSWIARRQAPARDVTSTQT